jgi:hypothetical protein
VDRSLVAVGDDDIGHHKLYTGVESDSGVIRLQDMRVGLCAECSKEEKDQRQEQTRHKIKISSVPYLVRHKITEAPIYYLEVESERQNSRPIGLKVKNRICHRPTGSAAVGFLFSKFNFDPPIHLRILPRNLSNQESPEAPKTRQFNNGSLS